MGAYDEHHEIPIIVRGEGCYVYDEHGKRYLDGLSALFCVNAGHGRAEIGEAAAAPGQGARLLHQLELRASAARSSWPSASPASPPGDLNRVFFTSGGSEAVESAWKLARAVPQAQRRADAHKIISRETAYHGTTFGALSITGITPLRTPFEPLVPGACHVPNTNRYRWPEDRDPLWAADQIEHVIEFQGPETVAAVILEPVQNSGGCFVPQDGYFQRVREICDRHGVLLISDEVICSWGRLGHYFGVRALRLPAGHDHHGQGAHVGLRADGRGDRPDRWPSRSWRAPARSPTASRSAGTRCRPRWPWPTSTSSSARTCAATCSRRRASSAACSRGSTRTCRSSATCAAPATSTRSSWSRTRRPRRASPTRSRRTCCAGSCRGELYKRGLICRADDRGDPVIQLSPPLIADTEQFEEIETVLRSVLTEAWERIVRH